MFFHIPKLRSNYRAQVFQSDLSTWPAGHVYVQRGERLCSVLDLLSGTYLRLCSVCRIASFIGSKKCSNIWWMAPVKPCGLQISYNVIPLLVWFPSMTLCEEQSAAFSRNMVPRFKYPEGGGGDNTHGLEQHDPKIDPFQGYLHGKMLHMGRRRLLKGVYFKTCRGETCG